MRKGKTGTHQTELTVERGTEVRGMLEDVLPSKTMLAVNDITVKATNMSQSKSTVQGILVHVHIKNTANYHGNTGALYC